MSLSPRTLQELEAAAGEIAARNGGTYAAEAVRCLLDTRDPIAALDLLAGLWGSSHAKRANQRAGLEKSAEWLEKRIQREHDISVEQLALELGWVRRFITIRGGPDRDGGDLDDPRERRDRPARAPFAVHLDQLRVRRNAALAQNAAAASAAAGPSNSSAAPTARPTAPVIDRLPDSFDARFTSWPDAIDALRRARDRRKQGKPPKERLLDILPIATELHPLAADLACSMLATDGMQQLIDHAGDLPTFRVSTADLAVRDGKRVPSQIAIVTVKRRLP